MNFFGRQFLDALQKKSEIILEEKTERIEPKKMTIVRQICITKEAFDEYLADKITTKMKERMNKYAIEDEPLYGYAFGLENPTDRNCEYTVCMLIDCDNGYMPIFNTGINTSSCFAMWSCGIYADYDEEEDNEMDDDQLKDLCCEEYKNGFVKCCEAIRKRA